jgi:hypothetical protein
MKTNDSPTTVNPYEDYRYYYREGMPLRPGPERLTDKPAWGTLRHRIFDNWHDVKDTWDGSETDQTRLLDDHMWQVDEAAVDVAAMFKRIGSRKGRAAFNLALEEGIDKVENPEPELIKFFEEVDNIPSWIDLEAAERGRIAYYNVLKTSDLLIAGFSYWATTLEDRTSAATGETGMFVTNAMQRALETANFFIGLGVQPVQRRTQVRCTCPPRPCTGQPRSR